MSIHNGRCDHEGCGEIAVHHGPQYSECIVHHAQTITEQEIGGGPP